MLGELGRHGFQDTDVIHNPWSTFVAGHVRKEIAHPAPSGTTLAKLPRRFQDSTDVGKLSILEAPDNLPWVLTIVLLKVRFVIERINLRYSSLHEQKDDTSRATYSLRYCSVGLIFRQ